MNLLLDARKKIELALEQSGVHSAVEPQLSETMRMEDSPPANAPQNKPDDPPHNLRAAGQNLFAAKAAPAKKSIGIIPIAIVSGVAFAVGGGYYVWREISPPPMAQQHVQAPQPATPIAKAAPAPQPVAPTPEAVAPAPQSAPTLVAAKEKSEPVLALNDKTAPIHAAKDKLAIKNARVKKSVGKAQSNNAKTVTDTASSALQATTPQGATSAQPVRIEHGQESNLVDPTLLAAWQAYRNGDLGAAWQHYSDALRKDPKNRDALLGLAAIAQQQSQDATAAHYYGQVLALDPRDPLAHAGMSALFGATNAEGAESRLKILISQQPQSAALNFALGNRYAEQSRWADAQQAYFKAYNIDPGNAQFAFNLAVSLDHMGQGKPAAQYYQRALQLDKSGNAGFDRGQIQQRLHELTPP